MENWKEWRGDKAKELKGVSDHSERRRLLSFSKQRYSAYGGDSYWESREAKIVSRFIEEIKKDVSESIDQREIIKKYQELCCHPFGYYNFFNKGKKQFIRRNSRIKDAFDGTVREIAELEFFLQERIKVPSIFDEQADSLIRNAAQDEGKSCIIHATDVEMLPWFVNSDINNEVTASFLTSRFGEPLDEQDFTGRWFYHGIKRYEEYIKRLSSDIEFRKRVQESLMKLSARVFGSGKFVQFVHNFQIDNVEKVGPFRLERDLYLDHKEYLELKQSGFFEKQSGESFSDVELEIVSNALARFEDSMKGSFGTSSADMVLWLSSRSKDNRSYLRFFRDTESKLTQETAYEGTTPGISFIRRIQCANEYSLRRALRILGLNLYDSYEDYPIIVDKDGNLLWPKRMSHEEMIRMKGL